MSPTTPSEAIERTLRLLHGTPAFIAGSCAAAEAHGFNRFNDLDVFVPSQPVLFVATQRLLDQGYVPDDSYRRVWDRWLQYGLKGWHTNSMKLWSLDGVETNVVLKLVDGHPTTSLAQVLESFDFGLLGMGYDTVDGTFRDMRSFLFPGVDPDGPLPLMPVRRDAWRNGFVSNYNGWRTAVRYLKYVNYGYDLSAVVDDLVLGYRTAAAYHFSKGGERREFYAIAYEKIADHMEMDELDEMKSFTDLISDVDETTPLDVLMEKLQ